MKKDYKWISIKNSILLICVTVGIILTNNLWFLIFLLFYTLINDKENETTS